MGGSGDAVLTTVAIKRQEHVDSFLKYFLGKKEKHVHS